TRALDLVLSSSRPAGRAQPLEDGLSSLQSLPRCQLLPSPALNIPQCEERPAELEGVGDALVGNQRTLNCVLGGDEISLRRTQQPTAASGHRKRPGPIECPASVLQSVHEDGGLIQLAHLNERLDFVVVAMECGRLVVSACLLELHYPLKPLVSSLRIAT